MSNQTLNDSILYYTNDSTVYFLNNIIVIIDTI